MNLKNLILILLMTSNSLFSLLLYNFYNYDIIFSVSIMFNLFLSFFIVLRTSPDKYLIKLSLVYLTGFLLFICGRYIANILGVKEIYCFDFGYQYCLDTSEKIKINFLVNFSLIFFVLGFTYKSRKLVSPLSTYNQYFNKKILLVIIFLSFVTGFISLYFQLDMVTKAILSGYGVLYEGQTDFYQPPLALLSNTIFLATLAIAYSVNKSIKPVIFYLLISIYIFGQLISVLAGARSGFIAALIVLLWLFLGSAKLTLKKITIIIGAIFTVFLTNYLASISGARITSSNGSIYEKIVEEVFYGQGISMMVFSLGTLESDYPLLAYLKTIFPGIQAIYTFFSDINPYELSFSQSLTYRLAPSVYYNNMGWGWSLLGDFYAFSFGFSVIFLFYNFIWGRLIFKISLLSNVSIYYRGLFFCFLIMIFSINRASISYLIFLVVLYTVFSFSLRFTLGKRY